MKIEEEVYTVVSLHMASKKRAELVANHSLNLQNTPAPFFLWYPRCNSRHVQYSLGEVQACMPSYLLHERYCCPGGLPQRGDSNTNLVHLGIIPGYRIASRSSGLQLEESLKTERRQQHRRNATR